MSAAKWTKEPWRFDGAFSVTAADGSSVAGVNMASKSLAVCAANASRIAACVNFCKGVPSEALTEGGLAESLNGFAKARDFLDSARSECNEAAKLDVQRALQRDYAEAVRQRDNLADLNATLREGIVTATQEAERLRKISNVNGDWSMKHLNVCIQRDNLIRTAEALLSSLSTADEEGLMEHSDLVAALRMAISEAKP